MKISITKALFTLLLLQIATAFAYANGPGNLDLTFAGTGYISVDPFYKGSKVVVQPDGKILTLFNTSTYARTFIARYNSDGTLDTAFGNGGKIWPDLQFGFDGSGGSNLLLLPDGKIVFVGSMGWELTRWVALARYDTNGTLDTSFDGDGKVLTRITGHGSWSSGAAIGPDGKVVVIGQWYDPSLMNYRAGIVRYNTDGSLDTSFDGDGQLASTAHQWMDVAVQADGKIVTFGAYIWYQSDSQFRLGRYNVDGSADTSFDVDGVVTTPMLGSSTSTSIVLLPDGRILAGGHTTDGSDYDFCMARYNSDGSLDPSFNGAGKVITPVLQADDYLNGLVVQSDGKIVASGSALTAEQNGDMALIRYNVDGSLDSTYGSGGKAVFDLGFFENSYGLALDSSNKAVIVGIARVALIARITSEAAPLVDVGGRVTSTNGQGIGNATLVLTDENNNSRFALTNAFGFYSFPGVSSNEIYVVRVSQKRYRFQPSSQTITVTAAVGNLDFVGNPGSESKNAVPGGEKGNGAKSVPPAVAGGLTRSDGSAMGVISKISH